MTDHERAFLDAILSEPGEQAHKLAYADWLRDQDRHWLKPDARLRHADAWEYMARRKIMFYFSPHRKSASWTRRRKIGSLRANITDLPHPVFASLPRRKSSFRGAGAVQRAVAALADALADCRAACK